MKQVGAPSGIDSMFYIEHGKWYLRSNAILRISVHLPWLWPFAYLAFVIPRPLRDVLYDWFARHRYQWFGKRSTCRIPTPEERARFL